MCSPNHVALWANPFSKVTDLFCRLPLPTCFYRLEAVHLGDLMRLWVRPRMTGHKQLIRCSRIFSTALDMFLIVITRRSSNENAFPVRQPPLHLICFRGVPIIMFYQNNNWRLRPPLNCEKEEKILSRYETDDSDVPFVTNTLIVPAFVGMGIWTHFPFLYIAKTLPETHPKQPFRNLLKIRL